MARSTLGELENLRRVALEQAAAGFEAVANFQRAAMAAGASRGSEAAGLDSDMLDALKGAMNSAPGQWNDKRTTAQRFADKARKQIDRAMWLHVIDATDLERLMDRQERDSFRSSLSSDCPEWTVESVAATLERVAGDAGMLFKRGIANAFASLDRRFRSHDGFKVGGRIILDRAFNEWGGMERRPSETLRDIERVFQTLDDDKNGTSAEQIAERAAGAGLGNWLEAEARRNRSRPLVIEGDWVRVRIFGNGNAHLWFTRPDLVRQVNLLLADYYGEAIGEGSDVCDVSDLGPSYHLTPARDFGYFPTSEEIARALFERVDQSLEGLRILEPSAGKGALAAIAKRKGARVECVEIQTGLCAELRAQGFATRQADFLTLDPSEVGQFDGVVMNPPFDRGRDCDHVRHALQFVKPGGFLIAIMSAGTVFRDDKRTSSLRALVEQNKPIDSSWRKEFFRDLPAGSFAHAGTNVNTVTLALRKA